MKILKVEIQNINSLKSATPILIDFENEQFKDVGLFAITGSTGAGKTTILDAITIAMYHNVPRFNGNKGSLINVVSHGANDAFSRITFENDNIIYEVFWSIRIADKNGKPYKNPKEEVSLKNLTSNEILANQKRNLLTEVIKVTRLDYNQFLRSVLLAQGEFASFLTAKGPDKGKLLEQITGEKIYKKIGQGILERKSFEEKKLENIKAKINADDVLNDEAKELLTQKNKDLDEAILKTETELKATQLIVEWYTKQKTLQEESNKLIEDSKKIDLYVDKHKADLALLALHQKAIPFKELVQEYYRKEKDKKEKETQLNLIEKELKTLTPILENLNKQVAKDNGDTETANKEFTNWLPKFDAVTTLDNKLKNEIENKQKITLELKDLILKIQKTKEEEKKCLQKIAKNEKDSKQSEEFLIKNSFLKEVDKEISSWTQDLILLKADKKSLNEDNESIVKQTKEKEKIAVLLQEETKQFDNKTFDLETIKKKFDLVSDKLAKNDLEKLLDEKKEVSEKESNWKQFENLSKQTIKADKELFELSEEKQSFDKEIEAIQKELKATQKEFDLQEKAVTDASKILELEKSIAKYEADRQHLTKGEPCGLCGSKEHPFTDNLQKIDVSKAELELNKRKEELQIIRDSKNSIDKKEVALNTSISSINTQITAVTKELTSYKNEAKELIIACDITDLPKIKSELDLLENQIKNLDEAIKVAQDLQKSKNELSEKIETQKATFNILKTAIATRKEKVKNIEANIVAIQKSVGDLTKSCGELESSLKVRLVKFNYNLPTTLETDVFIKDIEASIVKYNNTQKEFTTLKAEHSILNNDLKNYKNQLEVYFKTEKEYTQSIQKSDLSSEKTKEERNAILPITITVDTKRNALQSVKDKSTEQLNRSKKELQKQLDTKTEKNTLKEKNSKEQKVLDNEFTNLKATLQTQIINSDFDTKEAIEKALLDKETVSDYTNKKEGIERNQLKLKTLKNQNLKDIEVLNSSKNFEITAIESKLALETLNKQKTDYITEKGKIEEALRKDKEIRNRNKEVYKKIDTQESVCCTWRDLFKLIGNSKDAFNTYVQRLTLKHLLDLANVHLYKLNKRYSLKMEDDYKPKEELNFNLIDHYQTDQERLVDTSSGGEKFIISLALALGLSDLASKNVKIDSLFIDEGFGTLDKNTLETVISTLETLQSQGKMIGIISHVENLKERISTQIQITKKSNGVSAVAIV